MRAGDLRPPVSRSTRMMCCLSSVYESVSTGYPDSEVLNSASGRSQHRSIAENHRSFHEVFQFPHVPRPFPPTREFMVSEGMVSTCLFISGQISGRNSGPERDVVPTITKRRHANGRREAIVQIAAKVPFSNRFGEIAVGSSNERMFTRKVRVLPKRSNS